MEALDRLTKEDVACLRRFATLVNCGVRYKSVLRDCWDTGVFPWGISDDDKAHLRRLRNTLGIRWLSYFHFKNHEPEP